MPTSHSPGKSGLFVPACAWMQAITQMSTLASYCPLLSRSSGARYHRVPAARV